MNKQRTVNELSYYSTRIFARFKRAHFIFLGNLFRFLNLNPNLTLNLQAQEGD
ncbi:MAG: hypothetical protein ABSG04_03635 [Verrucomicrobiota bacterium]